MPDDPVTEIVAIVESTADAARTETLEAVATAEQAAQIDRIEDKLETIEQATPVTPVSNSEPTTHDHPEIISAIYGLRTDIQALAVKPVDVAEDVAESAIDTTTDVAEGVAAGATDIAETVEQAPRRSHFLFKKWF